MESTRQIRVINAVEAFVKRHKSQRSAATALGISAATLSNLLAGKVDNISEDMWLKLDAATAGTVDEVWSIAETTSFQEIVFALEDAQKSASMTWIVGDAGCGKTTASRLFASQKPNSYYILCSEDMKKSDFLKAISRQLGVRTDGLRNSEIPQTIANAIVTDKRGALLIFDEADKLQDNILAYFIQLYNMLEGFAGIALLSTAYIKKRMQRGLACQKRGYAELHSRMGRRFFDLSDTDTNDVYAVCSVNGITDRHAISQVISESREFDFDLRRVKRSVRKQLMTTEA